MTKLPYTHIIYKPKIMEDGDKKNDVADEYRRDLKNRGVEKKVKLKIESWVIKSFD